MSAQECPEPTSLEQYRNRRIQREPLSPATVKAILTNQADSETVSVSYAGTDADIIRRHAELSGVTPEEFVSRATAFAISARQLHEQGFEWPILRFVPPYLRFAQTAMDNTVLLSGGSIQSVPPVNPEV